MIKILLYFLTSLLTLSLIIGCGAASDSIPCLPHSLYGTVETVDGTELPVGTIIEATVNGESFTYKVVEPGKFGGVGTFNDKVIVSPSTSGENSITFTIDGAPAKETIPFVSGGASEVTLTLNGNTSNIIDTGTNNGVNLKTAYVISENSQALPNDFMVTINDVTASEKNSLPPYPSNFIDIRLMDISVSEDGFTVYGLFTISEDKLNSLDVTPSQVALYHHNEAANSWEKCPSKIISVENGVVTYSFEMEAFSAYVFGVISGITPTITSTVSPTVSPTYPVSGGGNGGSDYSSGGGSSGSSSYPYSQYQLESSSDPINQQTISPTLSSTISTDSSSKEANSLFESTYTAINGIPSIVFIIIGVCVGVAGSVVITILVLRKKHVYR